jgi:uncharacterized cupredoxin-like copper-binding protein
MMRKLCIALLIVILSLVVLSLAACGGGNAASGPTEVHVKMSEFKFEMDKTSIPAGPVKFIFENVGTITHEGVLERAGDVDKPFEANDKESEVENVEPGQTATLEWTIDQPGQYQLGCHIVAGDVDHFAAGMVTTFTVTAR